MDYQTAWFYFFSAAPQTLAGAVGLVAAFVLFRLDRLTNRQDSSSERFFDVIEEAQGKEIADQGRDVLRHNGWDSFLDWLKTNVRRDLQVHSSGDLWLKLSEFGRPMQIAADVHREVLRKLRNSIITICVSIACFLFALPCGAVVPKSGSPYAMLVFASGIFVVAWCVWTIIDVTLHALTKSDTAIRDAHRMAEDWELDA
jgi:hypothetical protein